MGIFSLCLEYELDFVPISFSDAIISAGEIYGVIVCGLFYTISL